MFQSLTEQSRQSRHPPLKQLPSFSLHGAIEFRQVIATLQKDSAENTLASFDIPVSPFPAGRYHPQLQRSPHQDLTILSPPHSTASLALSRGENEINPRDNSLGLLRRDFLPTSPEIHTQTLLPRLSKFRSPDFRVETPSESRSPTPSDLMGTTLSRSRLLTVSQSIRHTARQTSYILFPTLQTFRSKTLLGKIVAIFAAPAVLALSLTLPVVITTFNSLDAHATDLDVVGIDRPSLIDFEEEGIERALTAEATVEEGVHELRFNKWLMSVQCALGPVFCALVLFCKTILIKFSIVY
jgi:solute carrier family 24 (sodium/potassium/calcium exchanger), member 6